MLCNRSYNKNEGDYVLFLSCAAFPFTRIKRGGSFEKKTATNLKHEKLLMKRSQRRQKTLGSFFNGSFKSVSSDVVNKGEDEDDAFLVR